MKKKIVFTGGHHNSSLVVAKAAQGKGYEVSWIGQKYAHFGIKALSAEYQEVTSQNIPFLSLKTGKFYRRFNPLEFVKIVLGFFQSLFFLIQIRPDLIISFGGYLAVPVVIAGFLLQIPSITHEQTTVTGWANKAIIPFVRKVLFAYPSSKSHFPKNKSLLVGLPLENELFDRKNQKIFHPQLLFITCGKQGSHVINKAIFPLIPSLVKKFTIVHQIGTGIAIKDLLRARRLRDSLGEYSHRYKIAPYYFGKEFATLFLSASIIISRSGAHTCYKLATFNKRSILIPIPWASHNEQLNNAIVTQKTSPTVIVEENNLSPESLYDAIQKVRKIKKPHHVNIKSDDATAKILTVIDQTIGQS